VFELRANDPEANRLICTTLGLSMSPVDVSFSRWKDGELMGGVVYQRYVERVSILIHVASFKPNWLNRDFLWVAFHYPFEQLKCQRLFGMVNENNEEALKFDLKLGFKVETRIRKVYPDGDQIILVMERDKCRWLGIKPKYMQSNARVTNEQEEQRT